MGPFFSSGIWLKNRPFHTFLTEKCISQKGHFPGKPQKPPFLAPPPPPPQNPPFLGVFWCRKAKRHKDSWRGVAKQQLLREKTLRRHLSNVLPGPRRVWSRLTVIDWVLFNPGEWSLRPTASLKSQRARTWCGPQRSRQFLSFFRIFTRAI